MVMILDWKLMPEGREKYNAYLASREWSVRKRAVHERAAGRCERCKNGRVNHVHHLTYIRKYQELLTDLLGVCEPCHSFIHGHSDHDPALHAPPILLGKTITSVYLAGKISGADWRSELVPDWGSECDGGGMEDFLWEVQPNIVAVPGKQKKLALTGPHWRKTEETWGHGNVVQMAGEHRSAGLDPQYIGDMTENDLAAPELIASGKQSLAAAISSAIAAADLIFAWIDCLDCYGTIFELGFAKPYREKRIVVAMPEAIETREIWLPITFADQVVRASNVKDAWDLLWK